MQSLAPELVGAICEHLDRSTLLSVARTSRPLQYASERLLYREIKFLPGPFASGRNGLRQAICLQSISASQHRAPNVQLMILGKVPPKDEANAALTQSLKQAMQMMVNLKRLAIHGTAYLRHAQLDSAPFTLTHLCINPLQDSEGDTRQLDNMLLRILQAHDDITDLSLICWPKVKNMWRALERIEATTSKIICPRLERLRADEETIRAFLPGRRLASVEFSRAKVASGHQWISNPLISAYKHLRKLVICVEHAMAEDPLVAMAPHLVVLTHLHMIQSSHFYPDRATVDYYTPDPTVSAMVTITALRTITHSASRGWCTSMVETHYMARYIFKQCAGLEEIFVQSGADDGSSYLHYGSAKGKKKGTVDSTTALKAYSDWVYWNWMSNSRSVSCPQDVRSPQCEKSILFHQPPRRIAHREALWYSSYLLPSLLYTNPSNGIPRMGHFNDFPQEVICAVLENLDILSLTSTAIVATWLQYASERLMYRAVSFTFPKTTGDQLDPLQIFLRTTSLSERRARYVDSLDLQEFRRGEKMSVTIPSLERAMKNMVNLKKLSIVGSTYIRHAHLESATFSLTHLFLDLCFPQSIFDEYEILLPILKAHPELKALSLQEARVWTTRDDFSALEEQQSDLGDYPSAVLCPRLEYFESDFKSLTESILAGRCIKHLILNTQGQLDDARLQWGPPSTFPRYSHLETLVLLVDMAPMPSEALPILLTHHLTTLTRLNIHADMMIEVEHRPVVHSYTPDPLLLSIAQIQTLESLMLSAYGPWCTSPSEEEDMVRFLYKSLPKLKEAFVESTSGQLNSHSHYGAKGELVGTVDRQVASAQDFKYHIFGTKL